MKFPASYLQGEALDWCAAKSLNLIDKNASGDEYQTWKRIFKWDPSTNGDVINLALSTEDISLKFKNDNWIASARSGDRDCVATDKSNHAAVLRCHAIIKLGDEIDIPDDVLATFAVTPVVPRRGTLRGVPPRKATEDPGSKDHLLKYETSHFLIEIDVIAKRGTFTSKKLSTERAGKLIFEEVAGKLVLADYEGIFMLPPQVEDCLAQHGVDVSYVNPTPD